MGIFHLLLLCALLLIGLSPDADAELGPNEVLSLAYSPDGSKIAVAGGPLGCLPAGTQDRSPFGIRILDAQSGNQITSFEGHLCSVNTVTWSPDGTRLASTGDDGFGIVWSDSGNILGFAERGGFPYPREGVIWNPDGQLIADFSRRMPGLLIWDAETGATRAVLLQSGDRNDALAVDWSPLGDHIAVANQGGQTQIWDVSTVATTGSGQLEQTFDNRPAASLAWNEDGTQLALGGIDLLIINPTNGDILRSFTGHTDVILDVDWSPDGTRLASGGLDGTVRIWDVITGDQLSVFTHPGIVKTIAWHPNSTTIIYGGSMGNNITTIQFPTANAGPDHTVIDSNNSGSEQVALDGLVGRLIYRRSTPTAIELVSRTSFSEHVFHVPVDACMSISETGIFIATSTNVGTDIIVQQLLTEEVTREFSWQSMWSPCFFFWPDDTTLRIKMNDVEEFVDLNIKTGDISQFVVPLQIPPDFSQLPSRFEDQPVLPSPSGNMFVYERCLVTTSVVTQAGEELCAGERDWVIYDASTQQNIIAIATPRDIYLDVSPYDSTAYATWSGVEWSPDSRFLVYVRPYSFATFPMELANTETGQIVKPAFVSVDVDTQQELHWSPDSRRLAFWVKANMSDLESSTQMDRTLVIFDIDAGTFVSAKQPHIPLSTFPNGLWSPDASSFMYIDMDQNLIHVSATTGDTSIIDSNVIAIELWVPLESSAATATPETP